MVFVLPPRSQVGYLDPEIAGEGQRVLHSDGDMVNFTPPPARPVTPDWSGIKSIAKYFGAHVHRTWPAWLYHPTEKPRLVRNEHQAAELGVCYRDATIDERGRYGVKNVWDYTEESKWRAQPWPGTMKFDPSVETHGKNYMPSAPNPIIAQNALLEALIPTVTAAVIGAMKNNNAPSAPAHVDAAQWDEFIAFQAWKKSAEAVKVVADQFDPTSPEWTGDTDDDEPNSANALSGALTPAEERGLWEAEAERKGVKLDKRWSLERLKSEVERAA